MGTTRMSAKTIIFAYASSKLETLVDKGGSIKVRNVIANKYLTYPVRQRSINFSELQSFGESFDRHTDYFTPLRISYMRAKSRVRVEAYSRPETIRFVILRQWLMRTMYADVTARITSTDEQQAHIYRCGRAESRREPAQQTICPGRF